MDKIESIRRGEARRASGVGRRQSLTTTNVQQYQEKQKEKTAKYKAEREARKGSLGAVHKRIMEYIASDVMKTNMQVVEDFILDSEKQMKLFENFIEKGGRRTLIVYVQMGDPPTIESGRIATVSFLYFYHSVFCQICAIFMCVHFGPFPR